MGARRCGREHAPNELMLGPVDGDSDRARRPGRERAEAKASATGAGGVDTGSEGGVLKRATHKGG
jgi:hypothetical protein